MYTEIPQTGVEKQTGPQQRRRIAAQQLPVATARKLICYVYIEQCSNVYTAKTAKIYEKTHKPHRTRTSRTSEAARTNTMTSMADVTRLAVTGQRTCVDWRKTKVMTRVRSVCLEVLLVLD